MNRNYTLIISAVVVLILLGIWVYLMFLAPDPEQSDEASIDGSGEFAQFDDLGNDGATPGGASGPGGSDQAGATDQSNTNEPGENYDPAILRQLTTRNVIGFSEIDTTSEVWFMESGVGHIYSHDLSTGVEERVIATTIPDARAAAFTRDGNWVVVKTGQHTGVNPLLLGRIDNEAETVTLSPLADAVADFTITTDGFLLYSEINSNSVTVRSYDFTSTETSVVFTTPFREAEIDFADTLAGDHYFYPRVSSVLEGFVYRVTGTEFERLPIADFGLAAAGLDSAALISHRDRRLMYSWLVDATSNEVTELSNVYIPEKCLEHGTTIYCAVTEDRAIQADTMDEWYRGQLTFSDDLWVLIGTERSKLIDITNFTGRQVDVVDGIIDDVSGDWYFRNKIDNTLWIYELSRLTEEGEDTETAVIEETL